MPFSVLAAVRAAVCVAAGFGIGCDDPAVLADGANVIVHLRPAPVVAKVAASTAAIRADIAGPLRRELHVCRFLVAQGAPALAPWPDVPVTAHQGDGHVMSFWRYQPQADLGRPDEKTMGSMLRDLHFVLRGYRGEASELNLPGSTGGPLGDIPAFLARPGLMIGADDVAALGAAYARLSGSLDGAAAGAQVLHGDAGPGNLMGTEGGWIWNDFEDVCTGPVAWDLAPATASPMLDSARVLAAYAEPVDAGQLAVCEQLRRLALTIWYCVYSERLPSTRERAAELLATWRN